MSHQTIVDNDLADIWYTDADSRIIEIRDEQPVLSFSRCHITIHLLVEDNDFARTIRQPLASNARYAVPSQLLVSSEESSSDTAIDSYERDMLAYAYRNQRPFRTRRIGKPGRITAAFPSLLKFVSEDTEVHLRASGVQRDGGRQVDLDVSACVTCFNGNGLGVLHVTFSPAPGFALNEYDLLKFAKLWEGGECITQPIALRADGHRLGEPWQEMQDLNDQEFARWTYQLLTALARWALGRVQTRWTLASSRQPSESDWYSSLTDDVFCVGTLDLLDENQPIEELLASIAKLLERRNDYAEVADAMVDDERSVELQERSQPLVREWQRLVAVGGLIQGLLDFDQIGVDELRDVYATVMPAEEQAIPSLVNTDSFTVIHKGTLLSVAPNTKRARNWKTSVNPYLAITHSVALYNEQLMRQAIQSGLDAVHSRGRPSFRGYPPMSEARLCLRQADKQLEQFVPNVFVYPSERRIYEICHRTRALTDLRDTAKKQLELSHDLVEYRERKHGAVFAIIALVLGLIASVEGYFVKTKVWVAEPFVALVAIGIFPLMIYVTFYFWRRHH